MLQREISRMIMGDMKGRIYPKGSGKGAVDVGALEVEVFSVPSARGPQRMALRCSGTGRIHSVSQRTLICRALRELDSGVIGKSTYS